MEVEQQIILKSVIALDVMSELCCQVFLKKIFGAFWLTLKHIKIAGWLREVTSC